MLARRPVKAERSSAAQRRTLDGSRQSASDNHVSLSFKDIERLVSLEMILSYYGVLSELRTTGKQLQGPCPIHRGSNRRQFIVELSTGLWHCFGDCEAGGKGPLQFVAAYERVPIERAAQLITEWFALIPPSQQHPKERTSVMTSNKPSHYLWIVEDRKGGDGDEKASWHRIAAAWPQRDGKGLTIQLPPGVSVSGRLILREYEEQKSNDK
jgi:hypothetical protein